MSSLQDELVTWCEKVQARVPDCEFFDPNDRGNPMAGWYCVIVNPDGGLFGKDATSTWGVSHDDVEHAAMLFLDALGDEEAKTALHRRHMAKHGQ